MRETDTSPLTGSYCIEPGRDIFGSLSLSGSKTSLYVRDDNHFQTQHLIHNDILGYLHDLTRVSLIDCIGPPSPGTAGGPNGRYYFADIFPHYVITGTQNITSSEERIVSVAFTIDDATKIFYDFDTFGTVFNASSLIEEVIKAKDSGHEIQIGPNPIISYYTGKRYIFESSTELGKVYATHAPNFSVGGPEGVRIDNTIFIHIAFTAPITFEECVRRTNMLHQFLEIMGGRPQTLRQWRITLASDDDTPSILNVYGSLLPDYQQGGAHSRVHPADVPLDSAGKPEEFSQILAAWLGRHSTWHDARGRYLDCLKKQNRYDNDRIVAAANMFDILPATAVPGDVDISEELREAKDESRRRFKELPVSPERDSVLNTLGRIEKPNLKQKVRHRAQIVIDSTENLFSELTLVTDLAVDCRNHYVHGSPGKIDYAAHHDIVPFLTDTLEFVFCASDLIEAGWDIGEYTSQATTMTHPLGAYRVTYERELERLKNLLAK